MSKRRMLHPSIIWSDAFLSLPVASQNLYFHLAAGDCVDDDGFVESPGRVLRTTKLSDEDLIPLIKTKYIFRFKSGAVLIKHWNTHNQIRKDRYTCTTCVREKTLVTLDINGNYDIFSVGLPNDNQRLTEVSLSEVSIGKVGLEERVNLAVKSGKTLEGLSLYFPIRKEKNPTNNPALPDSPPNGIAALSKPITNRNLNKKPVYGEFDNVILAEQEYSDLESKLGEGVAKKYVNRLSRWLYADPKRNKADHYRTIVVWYKEDEEKKAQKAAQKNKAASYDLDEYENSSQFD